MSGLMEPAVREQRKSLSELLAGRASKRKIEGVNDTQRLQESAVYLLNSHQDLSDLLDEIESPPCNKLVCPNTSSDPRYSKTPPAFPASFIDSALQGQASHLGLPIGILSARIAAAQFDQICRTPVDYSPSAILNPEQREKLLSLLQMVKGLLAQNAFCRSVFCQELWRVQTPPALEAVWHLHKEVVELEELLESSPDHGVAVEWLCSGLSLMCRCMTGHPSDQELSTVVLTDVVVTLIHHGFLRTPDQGKKPEHKASQVSLAVLDHMLCWVLDAITEGKQAARERLQTAEHWLRAFEVTKYRSSVPLECSEQFFVHSLTQVLTYRPLLKVSDAVRMQSEWSFAKASPLLTGLYRKLFVMFSAETLIVHLQQVLETHEVNWQNVLTCVSTLVICQSEAQSLVKDLLARLLSKAFESYELENIITAFLIARQAALEGPAAFLSYTEWFKVSFGSTVGYHSGSKKSLVFLFKFLSDLVPFEAPQYLKVHLIYPPFVPTKYRPVLLEYISLAKTRLADLKVSIEDMGLYEDLSSVNDSTQNQPQFQAASDVEKAIHIYENTGKIPASVMEASIFRRPYYNSRFLPALLSPRPLPSVPDMRMRFIDSLKRADKIPATVYSGYLQACHQEKERQKQGEPMETNQSAEPMENLKSALGELVPLITDPNRFGAVPAQIAVISERLGVLFCSSSGGDVSALSLPIKLEFVAPKIDHLDCTVADMLLKSFCKNVMVASSWHPPGSQGLWPALFVKMLCGHRRVLTAILLRYMQLVHQQGILLNDAHTLGLAVFAVHLNESKSLLPPLDLGDYGQSKAAEDKDSLGKFWNHLLECRTGKSLSFILRFCTAAVSYTLCKFPSVSQDSLSSYIPPVLIKKIWHALPRECLEARGVCCDEEAQDATDSWRSMTDLSLNWKKAAQSLWKQSLFSKLLQLEIFQLSFRDWLLFEMQLESCKDVLSEAERLDYHRWAVYQHYLPSPSAAGGCDGDLEVACSVIVNALVDFGNRCELSPGSSMDRSLSPVYSRTSYADIICRLQEMVFELELVNKVASVSKSCTRSKDHRGHFLFKVFQERIKATGESCATGDRLIRQQELLMISRVLVTLPPCVLVGVSRERKHASLDSDHFFQFVNTELKNICSRGCALPYDITEHFFRGLLSSSLVCEDPAEVVDSAVSVCQDKCPILITSAALWWPQLEPILCCQWKKHYETPLSKKLQRLRDWQYSITSSLSTRDVFMPSDPVWSYAAFVYFSFRRGTSQEKFGDYLRRHGSGADELLVPLLFFSTMDLISSRLTSKEGTEFQKCLNLSQEILGCLEERGIRWLHLFHSSEKEQGSHHILLRTASEHHLRMLPVAFYSLVPLLEQRLLIQEENFLDIAVQMYAGLVHLFVDGEDPGMEQIDSLELITQSRHYLLRSIPQCPKKSLLHINQILGFCGEFDPEVRAALLNMSSSSLDQTLYDEPILF
ncbi:Fanconi anemia group A protein [Lissotriton helveticus]